VPVGVEAHLPVDRCDAQFLFERIAELEAISGALGKREAMPRLFVIAVGARLLVASPTGNIDPNPIGRRPVAVETIGD
jgi:hypothetical protein